MWIFQQKVFLQERFKFVFFFKEAVHAADKEVFEFYSANNGLIIWAHWLGQFCMNLMVFP